MGSIYRPRANLWQYRQTGSGVALSAHGAAMARAVGAGGFSAPVAARSASAGTGRPGMRFTGIFGARAGAAGAAHGTGSFTAVLSALSAGLTRGTGGVTAGAALATRAGAASRARGSINFGVVVLVARAAAVGFARTGAVFAAELQAAAAARASGRAGGSFFAALAARGAAGARAAAILSAGAQLAVTARTVMAGFGRAVLAPVTPAVVTNPTLEIVAAAQQIPPGMKNVLTLTPALGSSPGQVLMLTATNKGPLQG